MNADVQASIRRNCGDSWVTNDSGFFYLHIPRTCRLDLADHVVQAEIAALLADEEVRRELSFHMSVLDAQIATMENAQKIAAGILAQLKQVKQ